MPSFAVSLRRLPGNKPFPAQKVLSLRHWLKMLWVHAFAIAAQVVNY